MGSKNQCHGALEDTQIVTMSILTTAPFSSYRTSFDSALKMYLDSIMRKGQIHAVLASHADSCAVPLPGKPVERTAA